MLKVNANCLVQMPKRQMLMLTANAVCQRRPPVTIGCSLTPESNFRLTIATLNSLRTPQTLFSLISIYCRANGPYRAYPPPSGNISYEHQLITASESVRWNMNITTAWFENILHLSRVGGYFHQISRYDLETMSRQSKTTSACIRHRLLVHLPSVLLCKDE